MMATEQEVARALSQLDPDCPNGVRLRPIPALREWYERTHRGCENYIPRCRRAGVCERRWNLSKRFGDAEVDPDQPACGEFEERAAARAERR